MEQDDFGFLPLSTKKQRPDVEPITPHQLCVMDFASYREWPPMALRCTVDSTHHYDLVGRNRKAIMVRLLELGQLTGSAAIEAREWKAGAVPAGFKVR